MPLRALSTDKALLEWVERLSQEDLPLFAHTARKIASISDCSDASVADMSQSILSDSAMTARVLRMANSAYYNPSSQGITTVSRAIVLLGFNGVRNIALSISMIDTILSGLRHERAIEEMVRAYHAAIQARALATKKGLQGVEEIFIAALLHRLGQLTFWCFSYGYAETLDFEYSVQKDQLMAERSVLGFTLNELTAQLNSHWNLSDLLKDSMSGNPSDSCSIQLIEAGYDVAQAAEHGWESSASQLAIARVSELLGIAEPQAKTLVRESAKQALESLALLGLPHPGKLIPEQISGENAPASVGVSESLDSHLELQMTMLRDLTAMLIDEPDVNLILSAVLEGLYRGLLLDRVVFSWVNQSNRSLKAKYVMGGHQKILLERFDYSLQPQEENLMTHILQGRKAVFIDQKYRKKNYALITAGIKRCLGDNDGFAMPIIVNGKPMGLMYADRCITRKPLDQMSFQAFQHFCEHINIAFKMLSIK